MSRAERGTALAETALVVGMALLVLFNSLQLALLGFYQVHADAAAFLTARVQSLSDSTTAQSTLASALPPGLSAAPTLTMPNGQSLSQARHDWQGLVLVPGAPGSTPVYGDAMEPTTSQSAVTTPFSFSAPAATLPNYFPQQDVDDARIVYPQPYTSLYLAQNLGTSNGNGWNGAFTEWQDHAQCYAKVNFPNSYAATQTSTTASGYVVDPKTNPWSNFPNNSVEATIYGWDGNPHTGSC